VVKCLEDISVRSQFGITKLIGRVGISRVKFYNWKRRFGTENHHNGKIPRKYWLTPEERQAIINFAIAYIASDEAEAGSAGEQPVRNSPIVGNDKGFERSNLLKYYFCRGYASENSLQGALKQRDSLCRSKIIR